MVGIMEAGICRIRILSQEGGRTLQAGRGAMCYSSHLGGHTSEERGV